MMMKRLLIFRLKVPLDRPVEKKSCGRCFAELLLHFGRSVLEHGGDQAPSVEPQLPVREGPAASAPKPANSSSKRPVPGHSGETPKAKKSASWSVEDVCNYLVGLQLAHISDKFRENGVDGRFLADLKEEELVAELGLTKLQARKVMMRLP